MKKFSLIIFIFLLLTSLFVVHAASKEGYQTKVKATVGQYFLSVEGYVSPYASIVMASDKVFLKAASAGADGNFSMPNVLIKKGFSKFCLTAVDFQKLGESETCFSIKPAEADVFIKNIFLPPTLGLLKSELTVGSKAFAFGYSMPQALVSIYLNPEDLKKSNVLGASVSLATQGKEGSQVKGVKFTTTASEKGFYEFSIKDLKGGDYGLFAKAVYKNKESYAPVKLLTLKVLSWWDSFKSFIGPVWIAIPIIILCFILLFLRLRRSKVGFLRKLRSWASRLTRRRK